MTGGGAHTAAEQAARSSYGHLLALLAASSGDVALAEDTLAAAFEQALITWPDRGVPHNPEGWLLTVARNRQRDVWGSAARRSAVPLEAALQDPGVQSRLALEELDPDALPDRLLDLLFVCAHPAIDPAVRTPLMLQTVLGYDAAQVAAAFSVPASTMAQRLVRAKRRIKGARIPFVVPGREQLPERLPPVLEAVYGCWSIDRSAEAAHLAVTLTALLPDEPEVWGLAALVTLSRARGASTDRYQPLDEQDPAAWDAALLADGERFLQRAAPGPLGRFQCEAAVQAVHCARAHTGSTDWAALRTLYEALRVLAPTLGGAVALAAVVGRLDGPAAGLAELDRIAADAAVPPFQPWWAARGHLLVTAGRLEEAVPALERALALTTDPAQAEHLRRRLTDLPHTRRTATRG